MEHVLSTVRHNENLGKEVIVCDLELVLAIDKRAGSALRARLAGIGGQFKGGEAITISGLAEAANRMLWHLMGSEQGLS